MPVYDSQQNAATPAQDHEAPPNPTAAGDADAALRPARHASDDDTAPLPGSGAFFVIDRGTGRVVDSTDDVGAPVRTGSATRAISTSTPGT